MHNVESTAPWLHGLPLLPASRVISDLIIWRRQAGDSPGPLSILRKSLNRSGDGGIVELDLSCFDCTSRGSFHFWRAAQTRSVSRSTPTRHRIHAGNEHIYKVRAHRAPLWETFLDFVTTPPPNKCFYVNTNTNFAAPYQTQQQSSTKKAVMRHSRTPPSYLPHAPSRLPHSQENRDQDSEAFCNQLPINPR